MILLKCSVANNTNRNEAAGTMDLIFALHMFFGGVTSEELGTGSTVSKPINGGIYEVLPECIIYLI